MSIMNATAPLPVIVHRQPDAAWLAASQETPLQPALPIIDAHHHFSEHWGGYLPQDLLADGAGHNIVATVYVQCGWGYRTNGVEALQPLGETESVLRVVGADQQAARTKVAAAIVGFADLRLGAAVDAVLAAQVEAGQGRFRGVRNSGAFHGAFKHGVLPRPLEGLYGDASFRRGYSYLSKHGLSFDAWIYHPQIDEVVDLARAFPETQLILDHVGGLLGVGPYEGRADLARDEWRSAMRRLAACPNVLVKIGGFGTAVFGHDFASRLEPPSSQALAQAWKPVVHETLEMFGVDRCMFESNFPVDRSAAGYGVVWNAFKRLAEALSPVEKDAVFRGTAARAYRIPG